MEATITTPSPAPLPAYLCIGTRLMSTEEKHYEVIGTLWKGLEITHYELQNIDTGDMGEMECDKIWKLLLDGNLIWE